MLEVQTVAFERYPYAEGTNSCFLKVSLCWRYKQLPSESTPTLEVQPYTGGTDTADPQSGCQVQVNKQC